VIVGQEHMVEQLMVALLAQGHCLLEGVPGVAKTLAVRSFATVVGGEFARIQFTPTWFPQTSSAPASTVPARRPSTSSSGRSS
jgi:MoxR-like ATPase